MKTKLLILILCISKTSFLFCKYRINKNFYFDKFKGCFIISANCQLNVPERLERIFQGLPTSRQQRIQKRSFLGECSLIPSFRWARFND